MITSAKYDEHGNIIAVIDVVEMTVPDDPLNRHRSEIAEWENAGNVIEPFVPTLNVPASVSARQFKTQLYISGLLEQVEDWISQQDPKVKIAYENSREFVRSEPMMQSGFIGLGFTTKQIDTFFIEASKL